MRYEGVYFPFARMATDQGYTRYLLLYNATTGKVEAFTKDAIIEERADGRDIRGFRNKSSYLEATNFFYPIPIMGKEQEREYCLAFRKVLNKAGYFLETIDLSGKKKMFSPDEAKQYIKSGNIMLGVKVKGEDRLTVSNELLVSYPLQSGRVHTAGSLSKDREIVDILQVEDEDE